MDAALPPAAADAMAQAASPQAIAEYRRKLREYQEARAAYEQQAEPYWAAIAEKRRGRNAKRRERLAITLHDRLGSLRALAQQAGPIVPQLVEQQRARFLERWQDAMGLAGGVTPEAAQDRALSEATAFAIRIDVAEELTRLTAHLDEIERLLDKGVRIDREPLEADYGTVAVFLDLYGNKWDLIEFRQPQ